MDIDHRSSTLFLFISLVLLFSSCKHKERQVSRSYYFWRNSVYTQGGEISFLKQHGIQRLYFKLMDIDWDEDYHAYPVTINPVEEFAYNISDKAPAIDIVPVIFITNKTFARLDSAEIPELAVRVLRKCFLQYDSVDINSERSYRYYSRLAYIPSEIQFDCDWTISTARKYFYFLQCIKSAMPPGNTKISATIRLHQFKYPEKTGVPPVKKGMLMIYNLSNVKDYSAANSIFDYDKASEYFTRNKDYPLPLDIALAAYSWGIIYRDKKFYMIENRMTADTLHSCSFLQKTGDNFYAVKEEKVFYNEFLRPGDEIKIEVVTDKTLMEAARLARKALNNDSLHIALFELSYDEINSYQHETIENVYNSFK